MLTYEEIAAELCVDVNKLSARCTKARGCFLAWICREILRRESHNLQINEKKMLFDTLRVLLVEGHKGRNQTSDLFNNGLMVLGLPMLRRLAVVYQHGNPHGVILKAVG